MRCWKVVMVVRDVGVEGDGLGLIVVGWLVSSRLGYGEVVLGGVMALRDARIEIETMG